MSRAVSKNPKIKSGLARRSRNVNLILLSIVLLLMIVTAGVIINGINSRAARNLVRAYSLEAAEKFYAFLSQNLTLVQKAARSRAITNWFADEGNEEKKAEAVIEMKDFAEVLEGVHMYFGVHESLNEYVVDGGMLSADIVPYDRLNPSRDSDSWYYECTGSKNAYTLNIDNEKSTNTWWQWINHKVIYDGKLVGVFCSGLMIPDIFGEIFAEYQEHKVRGYIIDRHGIIQSASTDFDI